jgi:hypothetical protein
VELLRLPPVPGEKGSLTQGRRSTPKRTQQRIEQTGEFPFDVNLAVAARARNAHRAYLAYLSLKTVEPERTGYLFETDAVAHLEVGLGAMGRKHPRKAAKSLLDQIVDWGFAEPVWFRETGRRVIRLKSPARIAELLGTSLGKSATIPGRECFSRQPAQWIYLSIIARRDGAPGTPRPAARQTRREMTGAGPVTQRRAERRAAVRVEQNWVVGSPQSGRPWGRLADGRIAHRIANSTQVRPHRDRDRLEERLVQRDDQRMYCYSNLHDASPDNGRYRYLGRQALAEGGLVNVWEAI